MLTTATKVRPSYDFRSSKDPKERDKGAHGAELIFAVTGQRGTLTYTVMTHWVVNPVVEWGGGGLYKVPIVRGATPGADVSSIDRNYSNPYASEIGVHSRTPGEFLYETAECEWTGGVCYGTYLGGYDLLLRVLIGEGDGALFDRMKQLYQETFGVEQ